MGDYFNKAIHDKPYMSKVHGKSGNINSEKDDKYSQIGTLNNNDKNIEDRYYGESDKIYQDDKKYFTPTHMSDNTIYYLLGGLALVFIVKYQ